MTPHHTLAAMILLVFTSVTQAAPDKAQAPAEPAPTEQPATGPVFVQQLTVKQAAEPPKSEKQLQAIAEEKAIGKALTSTAAAMLHTGVFATALMLWILVAGVFGGIVALVLAVIRRRQIMTAESRST